MSSVWTFRLKRRKRFSIDSPSCDRTSAKSASRNAVTRCVPSVPYKAWPDTLQPIHRSFCNEHPYVHGNELRTAYETGNQAFSKRLRLFTTREKTSTASWHIQP